jgi:hypothetical protein
MKTIAKLLFAIVMLMIVGGLASCTTRERGTTKTVRVEIPEAEVTAEYMVGRDNIKVIKIKDCEHVYHDGGQFGTQLIHYAGCKNPIHKIPVKKNIFGK